MMLKITSTQTYGARYFFLTILAAFILILLYINSHYAVFVIRDFNTGHVIFEKKVIIGSKVELVYIHSVTNQPVYEVFSIMDNTTLALQEMRYDSFGANLPVGPEQLADEKTNFVVEDGYYKITYQNRKFKVVPLRVGQVVSDHTLVFSDNTSVRLLDISTGGSYVELYVRPLLN